MVKKKSTVKATGAGKVVRKNKAWTLTQMVNTRNLLYNGEGMMNLVEKYIKADSSYHAKAYLPHVVPMKEFIKRTQTQLSEVIRSYPRYK